MTFSDKDKERIHNDVIQDVSEMSRLYADKEKATEKLIYEAVLLANMVNEGRLTLSSTDAANIAAACIAIYREGVMEGKHFQ